MWRRSLQPCGATAGSWRNPGLEHRQIARLADSRAEIAADESTRVLFAAGGCGDVRPSTASVSATPRGDGSSGAARRAATGR